MKTILLLSLTLFLVTIRIIPQSGTFDFSTGSQNSASIWETKSGVTLTLFSDYSTQPYPSMTLQDWSGYSSLYTGNVATMNGRVKPSCTLSFSQAVNITSFVVTQFWGVNVHLVFTPNSGEPFDMIINGWDGSVIDHDFINITSLVVTSPVGDTVNLAFDNVIMDGTLPVELNSFTGTIKNNKVELNWQSATETDNYGFEVERNNPPLSPLQGGEENEWVKIGFIPGSGNSNSPKSYSFTDNTVSEPGIYKYRLKQLDNNGEFEYSNTVELNYNNVVKFSLEQNYPNPFNPETAIHYQIPVDGFVTLKIYDVLGNELKTLVSENKTQGRYSTSFNATELSSGVYIYQVRAGEFLSTKKMTLVK